MKYKFQGKTKNTFQNVMVIPTILIVLLFASCKQKHQPLKNTDSDLITKINAVQEQIMAQGNVTEAEEQALSSLCSIVSHEDGLATYTTDNSVILKDVEKAPVYDGCENQSKRETRDCFKKKISTFIGREFDLNVLKSLNLSEKKTVEAFFIINESGKLTGMKVRNAEVTVQAEILRVLRKIPVMKPATQNGERISVLCSFIATYGDKIEVDFVYIPERPD